MGQSRSAQQRGADLAPPGLRAAGDEWRDLEVMTTLATLVLTASWADGGLALDEIEDVITFHDADLSDCVKGKTNGSPVMQFGISGDGGVLWNSVLRDSRPERAVCFSKRFRTWAFPPRAADTRVQLWWTPALRPAMPKPPGDGGLEQAELASVQFDHRVEVARCVQQFRKLPTNDGTFSNAVVISSWSLRPSTTSRCGWREPMCPRVCSRLCRAGGFPVRSSGLLRRSSGSWLRPLSASRYCDRPESRWQSVSQTQTRERC